MNILAIETSTEACSVALLRDDGQVFSEFEITPRQHTRYLPLMLDEVYRQADIVRIKTDYVTYSSGPGAFTGVRIAAATAQGLSLGLSVPLIPVSTLAVLAQETCDSQPVERIMSALDARMGEVYCAEYHKNTLGLVELRGEELLVKLELLTLGDGMAGAGSGFAACQQSGHHFSQECAVFADIYPTARALVKLARHAVTQNQVVDVNNTQINYIRNQVAEKKATPQIVF